MNSTPNDPHPDTSEDENTTERPSAAANTSDGLANPESTEQFHQAVEHRLSESTPADPDAEKQTPEEELDEDNPVTVDNPE
jgi:hypothetical protein